MTRRANVRKAGQFLLSALAIIYFMIDAVFLWLVKPVLTWLERVPLLALIGTWVRSLPPYAALALFVVPWAILEPAKPLGAWLIALGHVYKGVFVIVAAELLKLTLVERIFHINRDKLLSIPAFAWAYGRTMQWLAWLREMPAVQAAERLTQRAKAAARKLWRRLRAAGHSASRR